MKPRRPAEPIRDEQVLTVREYEEVTCLRMGREMEGQVLSWCAAYLVAVWADVPGPDAITRLMRETSTIDRTVLASKDAFSGDAVDRLEEQIARLRSPPDGKQRKLDAPGVLNLYRAYQRLREPAATASANEASSHNVGEGSR